MRAARGLLFTAGLLTMLAVLSACAASNLAPTAIPSRFPHIPPGPTGTPYYLPSATHRPGGQDFLPSQTPTIVPTSEGPLVIGYSVLGRPLEIYQFGNGRTARMIVAGIHGGNEWNTIALAEELIAELNARPELVPANVTLYILPNLNPDGAARAHGADGRANENGVDLNRNWPENWQAEWDKEGCWDLRPITSGLYPASEPETAALMNFILWRKIEALISYHSASLGIFAGGRPPDAASLRLAESVAAVSDYPWPPVDLGCDYTGNLTDWASARSIAAIDIELTDHIHTDLEQNLRILQVFLSWSR